MISATSSVVPANATASGARGANRDSSAACRSSTDELVEKRSPSSPSSSARAAGASVSVTGMP